MWSKLGRNSSDSHALSAAYVEAQSRPCFRRTVSRVPSLSQLSCPPTGLASALLLKPSLSPCLPLAWVIGILFLAFALDATWQLERLAACAGQECSPPQGLVRTLHREYNKSSAFTVAFFTTPRPFRGEEGARQRTALASWLRLGSVTEVVLLGRDPSFDEVAADYPGLVSVETGVDTSFLGAPLFNSVVDRARAANASVAVVVPPGLLLLADFSLALDRMRRLRGDWVLVAARWDPPPGAALAYDGELDGWRMGSEGAPHSDAQVAALVRERGTWQHCRGADVWAWNVDPTPLHAGAMPPFVVGGGSGRQHHYQQWLLNEILESKLRRVVDASEAVTAVHLSSPAAPSGGPDADLHKDLDTSSDPKPEARAAATAGFAVTKREDNEGGRNERPGKAGERDGGAAAAAAGSGSAPATAIAAAAAAASNGGGGSDGEERPWEEAVNAYMSVSYGSYRMRQRTLVQAPLQLVACERRKRAGAGAGVGAGGLCFVRRPAQRRPCACREEGGEKQQQQGGAGSAAEGSGATWRAAERRLLARQGAVGGGVGAGSGAGSGVQVPAQESGQVAAVAGGGWRWWRRARRQQPASGTTGDPGPPAGSTKNRKESEGRRQAGRAGRSAGRLRSLEGAAAAKSAGLGAGGGEASNATSTSSGSSTPASTTGTIVTTATTAVSGKGPGGREERCRCEPSNGSNGGRGGGGRWGRAECPAARLPAPRALSARVGLPFSLAELLRQVAGSQRLVVVAVVAKNYSELLMSWVCSLRRLAVHNFVVSALDEEVYRFATLQGLPVFRHPTFDVAIERERCHFGTRCFTQVTKVKSRLVAQILRLGYHALFSDVDVYWFRNPIPELLAHGPGHLVVQSDNLDDDGPDNAIRRINSGFYFARAEAATIAAFDEIVAHAATTELSEQPSFYDVLCGVAGEHREGPSRCRHPGTNLTVQFLDRSRYPNGASFLIWDKNVRKFCEERKCMVVHNNWVSGRKLKLGRQIKKGLWDYDLRSRMCVHSWRGPNSQRVY